MSGLDYGDCKVSVFRQVSDGLFDWYRMATQDERELYDTLIMIEERITEDDLWERLEAD